MTKPEAHALLNLAKLGGHVTPQQIEQALIVTGDLSPPLRSYKEREPQMTVEDWKLTS